MPGVYKTMLLLKKKKYAALAIIQNKDGTFHTVRETKGLDIVRRDWSGLAHRIGNIILDKVFFVLLYCCQSSKIRRNKPVAKCTLCIYLINNLFLVVLRFLHKNKVKLTSSLKNAMKNFTRCDIIYFICCPSLVNVFVDKPLI